MARTSAAQVVYDDHEDLLPRWMKSVIERQGEKLPAMPFQRAAKKNEGLLPPPRPSIMLIMARIAER
jgi:hypothetical protein